LSAQTASLSENVVELCFDFVAMAGSLQALASSAEAAAGSSVCETVIASNPLKASEPGNFDARLEY
jgi:hypothetical protein